MKSFKNIAIAFLVVVTGLFIQSCKSTATSETGVNETDLLLTYLEEHGDIVNHPSMPFFTEAEEIYSNLRDKNFLVIDVRPEEEFLMGHIENAVNVTPDKLLDYIENHIEPNSFEKIAVVCNNAHLSGYVVAILRMLGYSNTFNMRYGLSAWNEEIAARAWLAGISDDLDGKLETTSHAKPQPAALPRISTGKTSGYQILRERARVALDISWDEKVIDHNDIIAQKENYFIICYWPQSLYDQGHLPGAVQYNPRKDFKSNAALSTLPVNQPLVVYCYTGHTAVYVNAFLAIMGYDFRSLDYSSNGFNWSAMNAMPPATRSFSRAHIRNYPLVKQNKSQDMSPVLKTEVTKVQGGC
jgi:rhodanese-related sulfurtransferase